MKRNTFLVLFFSAAVLQLVAGLMDWKVAHDVSKVLLLPSLVGYYLKKTAVRSAAFLAALLFCWLGDLLLLSSNMFVFGLAAFLIGHLLYFISYRQHQWEDRSGELLVPQKIRFSLPIVLAGTGLVVVLFPTLGSLQIPVLVYGVVIVLMVMTALFRYGRTTSESFWLVFAGAALFMISDGILSVNRFLTPVPYPSFWIMLTYMSAQFMIVRGIVLHC
jgi:uncharacterized membrane protein YhhN